MDILPQVHDEEVQKNFQQNRSQIAIMNKI